MNFGDNGGGGKGIASGGCFFLNFRQALHLMYSPGAPAAENEKPIFKGTGGIFFRFFYTPANTFARFRALLACISKRYKIGNVRRFCFNNLIIRHVNFCLRKTIVIKCPFLGIT
jgi:hypothetical protein